MPTHAMKQDDLRVTIWVESRDSYTYAACCWALHRLDPTAEALAAVHNARDHSRRVVLLANSSSSSVWYRACLLDYAVEISAPLSADARPEPFRRLRLRGSRAVVVAFVAEALDDYRKYVSSRWADVGGEDGVPYWTWDEDGMWCKSRAKRPRPLHTLFLPAEADRLVGDFKHFCSEDSLETYRRLHASPTRVYMLHGLPGSGKTSLVHCIASEMKLGVATMTFGPGTTDADLLAALGSLPPQCVLCIDDIDCLFVEGRRMAGGITFAGLLSALDNCGHFEEGAATGVFVTTNRLCVLDPALKRRVDYVLEFGPATKAQAQRMFAHFFPHSAVFEQFWQRVHGRSFSMCVLQKYLLKAMQTGDPLADFEQFEALATVAAADTSDTGHMYA